jgi:hypothetical protein
VFIPLRYTGKPYFLTIPNANIAPEVSKSQSADEDPVPVVRHFPVVTSTMEYNSILRDSTEY